MTRAEAERILSEREGWPVAENAHVATEALKRAAKAPSGQPCSDCQTLVVWHEGPGRQGWFHADPKAAARCFLGQGEAQR